MSSLTRPMVSPVTDPAAFIAEQLGFVAMHADMAQQYILAGDNPGLDYSLKSLTARVRAIVGIANDLRSPKQEADGRG